MEVKKAIEFVERIELIELIEFVIESCGVLESSHLNLMNCAVNLAGLDTMCTPRHVEGRGGEALSPICRSRFESWRPG